MARALALLVAAGPAQAAIYQCDNHGRPAFTSQPGPGCVPVEVRPPTPTQQEVLRETQRWTLKQEEERVRAEAAEKAMQQQAEKNRDAELQRLQRELQRRNALNAERAQPPVGDDRTLEEGY
jgi:hypothetical protein